MKIIPKPLSITMGKGEFVFSASTALDASLEKYRGELFFLDFEKGEDNAVIFEMADTEFDYSMVIDDNVKITAGGAEGAFHALMTLKQLIFEYYADGVSNIPKCAIKDKPRYGYRGFMLDVSRHFFGVDTLKRVIDMLALIKMNVLHLHLSDNQGYRVESEKFPLLNKKIGKKDGAPTGEFYTIAELKDVVSYCADRFIDVMPEIDIPGHTIDFLAAYPELGCGNEKYEASDNYTIDDRIMCAGKESTYQFVNDLLDEVIDVFPYGYFHIGGDEVPKKRWKKCPDCRAALKREGLENFEQLQGYFTNRISKRLKERGKAPVVWNDALKAGNLDKAAAVQFWNEQNGAKRIRAALEEGRKVIVSKTFAYYLDYTYGMCSLKRSYDYDPSSLNVSEKAKKNIIGVEAPLWTEWVADEKRLFDQTFPRLFAVAETGWSAPGKNYADFEDRLENPLGIMLAYGLDYAPYESWNPGKFKGVFQTMKFFRQFVNPPKDKTEK